MRAYNNIDIASILHLDPIAIRKEGVISEILLDSRQVIYPEKSLFFALVGERFDAHHFIGDLYQKGVRNFCISKPIDAEKYPDANFWLVPDTTLALQNFVQNDRKSHHLTVIGITGSNGKTIVKEWLYQLLRADFVIVRSPKSYNSQVGVPLSVWQINDQHQLGIFEVGISKPHEMERLTDLVDCGIGIFTSIGSAHQEGFVNESEKVREKLLLFKNAKKIIYCKDFEVIDNQIAASKKFSWSKHQKADLQITAIQQFPKHTTISAIYKSENITINIPFTDDASIDNAITCWCYLLLINYDSSLITERMLQLEPLSMRLELLSGVNNCSIINDSYSVDLSSLKIALEFLSAQTTHSRRTLILSDILQSGLKVHDLYEKVAHLIDQKNITHFIGIGTEIRNIQPYLSKNIQSSFWENTDAFLQQLSPINFISESILIKGARSFGFEKIVNRLVQKVQPTYLEINLTALIHNLLCYQKKLNGGTKIMAMVKAAAYGSGSFEIAKMLQQYVAYLTVAYPDEGVELRKAGITAPIMVLNVSADSFNTMMDHHLEPEIFSISQLKSLIQVIGENPIKIHIKLDTGMKRLGFEAQDIPDLLKILSAHPNIKVASIFSHLAGSEAAEHDAFTHHQAKLFSTIYQTIQESIGYKPLRHLLNSSGISRFPAYQFDMVRVGIGLYGIDYHPAMAKQLKTVLTLRATISQIKNLATGETVGYGRKGIATQPSRIATISIGYADGFFRAAGNGNYQVMINGQMAPTIGNICMDMSMVDVTHIPDAKEGDAVLIFGEKPAVSTLAACYQTIAYEVFTSIAARVKRVYYLE